MQGSSPREYSSLPLHRRTLATRAIQAGMDVRRLQRLLGHKTLAMTMRYSHLAPSDLREAVESVLI